MSEWLPSAMFIAGVFVGQFSVWFKIAWDERKNKRDS